MGKGCDSRSRDDGEGIEGEYIFADVAELKKIHLRGRSADRWGDSSSISSPSGDQNSININIVITITVINIVTVIFYFLLLYIKMSTFFLMTR